ncbi:MAG: tRNA pseudouridine(55) synthase TruB [Polyangiaceae bacterium]|nr:tRNA pseudouridine(55) synthase TruB [Polyangiaceae bacterium]
MTAEPAVVVFDKPEGPTSHDVVARTRRLAGTRRVGHAGTLDPMASGVLLILLGEATKLSAYLTGSDKTYLAEVRFGKSTTTLDAQGEPTAEAALAPGWLDALRLDAALDAAREQTEQIPPSVSAIHVAGARAHERVRRGETLQLPPRAVAVRSLTLESVGPERVTLRLTVSAGYYVRALARDLGQALGVPAHLSALRRERSGSFTLAQASPFPPPSWPPARLSMTQAIERTLPVARLGPAEAVLARQGKRLPAGPDHEAGPIALLGPDGELVAIAARDGETLRVLRGFTAP